MSASFDVSTQGIDVSVVSVPSWDRFDKQPAEYKNAVLPTDVTKRLAIEMGSPLGWERYLSHPSGDPISIARRFVTSVGRTAFLYSAGCLSKRSQDGTLTTDTSMPCVDTSKLADNRSVS